MESFIYSIISFYKQDKRNTLIYFLTNIVIIPLTIIEIFQTQFLVSNISNIGENVTETLVYNQLLILFTLIFVNSLASSVKAISETNLTEYGLYLQEKKILEKNLKLSIEKLDNPEIKDLREKAKTFNLIKTMTTFTALISNVVSFTILSIILILYNSVYIIFIVVGLLLLSSLIKKWGAEKVEKLSQRHTSTNRVSTYLLKLLTEREYIQEIKVYSAYKYLKCKLKDIYMKNSEEEVKAMNEIEIVAFVSQIIITVFNVICMSILVVVINDNEYDTGVYIMLYQILNQLLIVMSNIVTNFSNMKRHNMQYVQQKAFMALEEMHVSDLSMEAEGALEVELHNVSFKYPGTDKYVLNHVNMVIKPGEKIAVVGKNGAGKSTFIKLLLGLYTPSEGTVKYKLNGTYIETSQASQYIRIVFQDYLKLLRSIRENVGIGNINYINDNKKLSNVLRKSHSMFGEDDLDKYLGTEFGGIDLSGGQWQRIAIARSYLKNGAMLIFDEATSALDSEGELEQLKIFLELGKNSTSIFITHRLSASKIVDKIAVFDDGELCEYGNHKQLYLDKGMYYQMFKSQSSFYA